MQAVHARRQTLDGPVNFEFGDGILRDAFGMRGRRQDYYDRLSELIDAAEKDPSVGKISAAVSFGIAAPDAIVAISALSSAIKIFGPVNFNGLGLLADFRFRHPQADDLSLQIHETLLRQFQAGTGAVPPDVPPTPPKTRPTNSVVLIHGTHFEVNPDPDWYYPHRGELHNYVRQYRPDIYSGQDFYEWEGRWSDRGRYIAAKHLVNWVDLYSLHGCDIVCHSHGGNVVMKAAERGVQFNKVVFLSCPVHWHKYNLKSGRITEAHAARARFDFVIFADGGRQKFPPEANLTSDQIVTGFFGGHVKTRLPKTWRKHNLQDLLL